MSKMTWTRLPNGDQQAKTVPIRLIKPKSRASVAPGWLIATPFDRDAMYDDGWSWQPVFGPDGRTKLEAFSVKEARELAQAHLAHILNTVAPEYGQPEDLEDAAVAAQHDAEAAAGTLKTVPHTEARERLGMPAADPAARVHKVTVTDETLRRNEHLLPDPYEQIGLRRPNANGWPVTPQLSSVQFKALLDLTADLDDGTEDTRPLREIHTILVNLDPR